MKRILAVGVAAALLGIVFSPSAQEALVLFVIAGLVPGTSWQLSPNVMIAGLSLAMAIALYAAYRQVQATAPPLPQNPHPKRSSRKNHHSVWRRRNALRPKLKLLQ